MLNHPPPTPGLRRSGFFLPFCVKKWHSDGMLIGEKAAEIRPSQIAGAGPSAPRRIDAAAADIGDGAVECGL